MVWSPSVLTVSIPAAGRDLVLLADVKNDWDITDTTDDTFLSRAITRCSAAAENFCNRNFGVATYVEKIRYPRDAVPITLTGGVAPLQLSRWPLVSVTSIVEGVNAPVTLDPTVPDYDTDLSAGQIIRLDGNGNARLWAYGLITVTYKAGYVLPYTKSATTLAFVASGTTLTDSANGLGQFQVGNVVDITGSTHNSLTLLVATAAAGAVTFTNVDGSAATFVAESAGATVSLSVEATLPQDIQDAVSRMVWSRYSERSRDPFVESGGLAGLGSVKYLVPKGSGNMSDDVSDILDNYRVPVVG